MALIARNTLGLAVIAALAGGAMPASVVGAEMYIAASAGAVSLDRTSLAAIGAPGSYPSSETAGKLGIGLKTKDNVAWELAGQYLGKFGAAPVKMETGAATLWLIGSLPVGDGMGLNLKVGPTLYQAYAGGTNDTGHGISIGAGLDFRVLANTDLTIDYERYSARVFQGRTSFDVYAVGLKYHL